MAISVLCLHVPVFCFLVFVSWWNLLPVAIRPPPAGKDNYQQRNTREEEATCDDSVHICRIRLRRGARRSAFSSVWAGVSVEHVGGLLGARSCPPHSWQRTSLKAASPERRSFNRPLWMSCVRITRPGRNETTAQRQKASVVPLFPSRARTRSLITVANVFGPSRHISVYVSDQQVVLDLDGWFRSVQCLHTLKALSDSLCDHCFPKP